MNMITDIQFILYQLPEEGKKLSINKLITI